MNLFETKAGNTIVFDKHKYGNAMRMFDHACDFSASADLLWESYITKNDCIFDYAVPAVVYFAFSCEIFLKTLLLCHNISFKKIHNLEDLYKKLPDEIKGKIEQNIYNCYDVTEKYILDTETLGEISNAFQEWRYLYEKNESILFSNTSLFMAFREVLREECCQTIFGKTWSVYKEKNYGEIR